MQARKTIDVDEIRIVTFTEIINDALGHPDIFGHPHRLSPAAVPKTEHVSGPVVEGAGVGRSLEWVVEVAEEWEGDDE